MSELSPLRTGRVTGSRVAAILGANPYQSREDVMRAMVREHAGVPSEFTGNAATRHGEALEPAALAAYEQRERLMTHGGGELVLHPVYDFLCVTPDGLVGDDGLIECKAPYRAGYRHIDAVPYYLPQVMLQLACTGRQWCDFVVLDRDGEIHISRVQADPDWLPQHLPALETFIADYRSIIADPERMAPFLAPLERSDSDWSAACHNYREALQASVLAETLVKVTRDKLIALAPAGGKGCGVSVAKVDRAGSVDYAKALAELAPGSDIEPYRKAGTTLYQVRVS